MLPSFHKTKNYFIYLQIARFGWKAIENQFGNKWLQKLIGLFTSRSDRASHKEIKFDESASKVIGNYISETEGFKNHLLQIKSSLQNYLYRQKPKRPMNVLIVSPPGTGKSFLIRQFLKSLGSDDELIFMEFHVGAMRSYEDLIAIFRNVQSVVLDGKTPFVFLDEVDAEFQDNYIYKHLLAPMADGIFQHGDRRFHLGRAVFFFAASRAFETSYDDPDVVGIDLSEELMNSTDINVEYDQIPEIDISPTRNYKDWNQLKEDAIYEKLLDQDFQNEHKKIKDFFTRIDWVINIPPTRMRFIDRDFEKENIAIAIALIKSHFKNVKRVDMKAVESLSYALGTYPDRRQVDKFIFLSNNPDDDEQHDFKFEQLPIWVQMEFEPTMSEDNVFLILKSDD